MKAFNGREFIQDNYPHNKKHEVILEDDENFFHYEDKQENIWCCLDPEEAKKIVEFVNNAAILGIDNKVVNIAYELRDILKNILG